MNKPKRHHYLPRFYLEGFSNDAGKLSVFDRQRNEFRGQTPINTAVKSHYYSVDNEHGEKQTEIEAMLSQLEGTAKPLIEKLEAGENLSSDEKDDMAMFIGFMMNRVPDFQKGVENIRRNVIRKTAAMMFGDERSAQRTLDAQEKRTGEKSELSAKEMADFHNRGNYEIEIHRNHSLQIMLSSSEQMANYFCQMDWGIFHAPSSTSFIATDNPVSLVPSDGYKSHPFYGVGIITTGAKKIFPLTKEACLVMYDYGELMVHKSLKKLDVRKMNLAIANHADQYVTGRDEALVKSIVKVVCLVKRERNGRFIAG